MFQHFSKDRLFVYKSVRFLREREKERERERERHLEWQSRGCEKALFYGDCCDRNQAIILVVLVLVSP